MPTCRLLLVDDHPALTRGLATLLSQEPDLEVVGLCASGHELLRLLDTTPELAPDLLLLDLHLPGPLRALDGVALRTVASPLGRLGTAAVGWALADPRDPRNSPASSQVRASPSA